MSAGAVIGIIIGILALIAIVALLVWLGYSYTHPTSNSGLFLIEVSYQMSWQMDSFREYNYATKHLYLLHREQ